MRRKRSRSNLLLEEIAAELRSPSPWWFTGTDPAGLAAKYEAEADRPR